MSDSEKKVIRAHDYRVLFTDDFDLSLSRNGVRLQVQQNDPEGHISGLVGLQMSHRDALVLSEALKQAVEFHEERTGDQIDRPEVKLGMGDV